jgi:hypothetical protein
MADDVRQLLLQIDATTNLLRSNLAQAENAVAEFQRSTDSRLDQVDRKFGSLDGGLGKLRASLLSTTGAVTGLFAAIGVGAIAAAGSRALDYASSLAEVAQQLGVTAEQLQVFRYAASQVGVSQDDLDKGLAKLTRTIGEAETGSAKAQKLFAALGVSLQDASGHAKSTGQLLPEIADALQQIDDPAKRAAIEVELFGKAGQKLDNLLSGGSAAISELTKSARDLGLVLDDKLIADADAAADKISELKQVLEARIASAVAENAGAIYDLARALETVVVSALRGAQALKNFYNARGLYGGAQDTRNQSAEALIRSASGRQTLLASIQSQLDQNVKDRASGRGGRTSYLGGLFETTSPATAASDASLDRQFQALTRQRNAVLKYQAAVDSAASGGARGAPTLGDIDSLNASGGGGRGRGGSRKSEISALQKLIDDLTKGAIGASNALDKIGFSDRDKDAADGARKFYRELGVDPGDLDKQIAQIESARDAAFEREKAHLDELALRQADAVRSTARLYEDLFSRGTGAVWNDFKQIGFEVISQVAARYTIGLLSGKGSGSLGSLFSSSLGNVLGFAGGGDPPVGKVSLVGERGPELFVPKIAGTIIPNGRFGGGPTQVVVHVQANDYFDAKVVSIAAPIGQSAVVGGAQLAQSNATKKLRRRMGR